MITLLRLLLLACLAVPSWCATSAISYRSYTSSYPLLVAVPSAYSNPSLVVTLHGATETGNGTYNGTLVYNSSTNAIAATLVHGALECVNNGVTWFADNNVIVAAPQTTSTWNTTTLDTTVAALIAEFGVNTSRICITGLSLGGGGAWNYAKNFPSRCYSVVPIAAALFPGSGTLPQFSTIKTYAVQDGDDPTVPPCWLYGTTAVFSAQPFLTAWLYEITGSCSLDNHPDSPTYSVHASYPHFNGVVSTYTGNYNGSAWIWTAGATMPTGTLGTTLYQTGGHGGWDQTYGTGPGDFNTTFWTWALGVVPTPAGFPDPLRSGNPIINSSLLFSGSQYVTLGRPSALTTVLDPGHEYTVLIRTARTASGSTGNIFSLADISNNQCCIVSNGGSSATGIIGGTSMTTGTGSIQNPTWNSIALVNRNASGTFMGRMVLDAAAGTTEVAVGTTTSTRDIMLGARRNSSNADAASFYSGNLGDVVIWNYALTDDQIHYAMGYIQPNEILNAIYGSGIVGYYPCNEGSGNVVHDGALGNDGTATVSTLFSSAAYPKYPVCTIGDSLTSGSGSQTGTPYGLQVKTGGSGLRNMRSSYPYGFAGQNVAFIQGKIQLSTYAPFLNWTQVYLVGIHDLGNNAAVTSFLSTAIAALPHNRYLIIGNRPYGVTGVVNGVGTPGNAGIGDWGTTARAQIDSQNRAVQAIYGSHWISEQYIAQTQLILPGEANDQFQLRTPTNICADNTHLLDVGYILQSQAADIALTSFGW